MPNQKQIEKQNVYLEYLYIFCEQKTSQSDLAI